MNENNMKKIITLGILFIIFTPSLAMANWGTGTATQLSRIINIFVSILLYTGFIFTIIGDIRFISLWIKKNHDKNKLATRGKMIWLGWFSVIFAYILHLIPSTLTGANFAILFWFFLLLFGNLYYLIASLKHATKHMIIGGKIMLITNATIILFFIAFLWFFRNAFYWV